MLRYLQTKIRNHSLRRDIQKFMAWKIVNEQLRVRNLSVFVVCLK